MTETPARDRTDSAAPYAELGRQLWAVGAINREMGRSLPHDCPPATLGLISVLSRKGEQRMGGLADLLGVDISVASRYAAHAVERGWVERTPDPADKRSRLLRVTASGEALLAELSLRYTDALARYLADWSAADVGHLNDLLFRLRTSFNSCRSRSVEPAD
ncbi:MarR family winged helix-turn-helix transcriptional regulator [Streptomyces carpaticus]|uniref:MarR family winged helix-turn-helix transcriptional regulator n=1 Tax=Streptomyces carpaticus TaxID=285558 RepID=A0ABV4ZNU0_9ACTN